MIKAKNDDRPDDSMPDFTGARNEAFVLQQEADIRAVIDYFDRYPEGKAYGLCMIDIRNEIIKAIESYLLEEK